MSSTVSALDRHVVGANLQELCNKVSDLTSAVITDINALQASVTAVTSDGTYTCLSGDSVGDWVYISAASTVASADADGSSTFPTVGVITSKPTTTSAVVRHMGEWTTSGLTAGAIYYLSTTAKQITATPPSAPYAMPVGIAKSTAVLLIIPNLLSAVLRSTANKLWASTIGIEDSAGKITGTNVESALAEIALFESDLGSTSNGKGASKVAIEDSGAFTSTANVEAALAEIYQDLKTTKLLVPVRLANGILAAGTPLAAFADNASSNPGVTLANSKAVGVRWNDAATQTAVWAPPIEIPYEADVSANATLRIICSKTGATSADATTFTVTAFAQTVGALHDADSDFGGTSSAITGTSTAKTIQASTLTLALADLAAAAAPACISMSIKPTDGTLGTDDIIVHAAFIEFKRKLRTS